MVAVAGSYADERYRAVPGQGFDGVVRIVAGNAYGTGVLLEGGRAVLTAAHLAEALPSAGMYSIEFSTTAGDVILESATASIHPDYAPQNGNDDLALLWLDGAAPVAAERYDLYRGDDEIGQDMTLVGYGRPGTGADGLDAAYTGESMRLQAENRFDAEAGALKAALGTAMDWTPANGTLLIADFDDGTVAHDALRGLIGVADLGLEAREGLLSRGDSGGPAFIGQQVAGIASYTASLYRSGFAPDVDATTDSSFGEVSFWQRVSVFQQWIDQSQRAHYIDAPIRPEDVHLAVSEGGAGITLAYFLVQFSGVRSDPAAPISIDYATRDGTAKAGEDYLPVAGRLVLYAGENQAVIPVEIVGDTRPEPAETFFLDVTNPVGGSFGEGVLKLTAVRTILDDDGWLAS